MTGPDYNWNVGPIIPHFTGALSMLGSGWIIFEILIRDRKKRLQRSYHRIMLGLSVFDFLSSLSFFASEWAVAATRWTSPSSSLGTIATCNASGFFVQLGVVSIPLYNTTLAMYYLLMIKYNWREIKMWRQFEKYAHALIIPTAFLLAIIPLPMDLYNQYYFYCFPVNNEEQGRGKPEEANVYFYLFYVVVTFSTIAVTAIMLMIVFHVVNQTKTNDRYDFERNNSNRSVQSTLSLSASSIGSNQSTRSRSRRPRDNAKLRIVTRNALLYTIPFYITWVLPAIFMLVTRLSFGGKAHLAISQTAAYVMYIYICTALPIQGFVNWTIYMQPAFPSLSGMVCGIRSACSSCCRDLFVRYCSRRQQQEQQPAQPQQEEQPQVSNKSNDDTNDTTRSDDKESEEEAPGVIVEPLEDVGDSEAIPATTKLLEANDDGPPSSTNTDKKQVQSSILVVVNNDNDNDNDNDDDNNDDGIIIMAHIESDNDESSTATINV